MKKSLIAAVFTLGLIGNAFAACDETPYNAPEELQPSCTEETPVAPNVSVAPTDKLKVKGEIDSKSESNADATENHASEKSSQSSVK